MALAPSLAYDAAVIGDDGTLPAEQAASITVSTLVIDCDSSPEWLRHSSSAVAAAVPGGTHTTLTGQDHFTMNPADHAPVLADFFGR